MRIDGVTMAAVGLAAIFFLKFKTVLSLTMNTQDALNNKNVQAFLAMIRQFESGGDYSILYGGGHFTDYSTHPNVRVPFFNPATQRNDYSTAAGAYQIINPTWRGLKFLGLGDFSPRSQDVMAVQLLKACGALADIVAGDFVGAIDSASGTWASLPKSTSGQRKVSMQVALASYKSNGGITA